MPMNSENQENVAPNRMNNKNGISHGQENQAPNAPHRKNITEDPQETTAPQQNTSQENQPQAQATTLRAQATTLRNNIRKAMGQSAQENQRPSAILTRNVSVNQNGTTASCSGIPQMVNRPCVVPQRRLRPLPVRANNTAFRMNNQQSAGYTVPRQPPANARNIYRGVNNVQYCVEYAADNYEYLFAKEALRVVKDARFLDTGAISVVTRAGVINRVMQTHAQLLGTMVGDVFQLALDYVDRFLSKNNTMDHAQLELTLTAALLLATKIEEVMFEIGDFVECLHGRFSRVQLITRERELIRALDYDIMVPYPLLFLRLLSKAAEIQPKLHNVAKYLMELTVGEELFIGMAPSKIAAVSMYLTLQVMHTGKTWDVTMRHYSRCEAKDLRPLAQRLFEDVLRQATRLNSKKGVVRKYSDVRLGKVSLLPEFRDSSLRNFIVQ